MKKRVVFAGLKKNQNQVFFVKGHLGSYTIFVILLNIAFDSVIVGSETF